MRINFSRKGALGINIININRIGTLMHEQYLDSNMMLHCVLKGYSLIETIKINSVSVIEPFVNLGE